MKTLLAFVVVVAASAFLSIAACAFGQELYSDTPNYKLSMEFINEFDDSIELVVSTDVATVKSVQGTHLSYSSLDRRIGKFTVRCGAPIINIWVWTETLPGALTYIYAYARRSTYTRYDANSDGRVNILDLIYIRQHLGEDVAGTWYDTADVTCDGFVTVADLQAIRSHMSHM